MKKEIEKPLSFRVKSRVLKKLKTIQREEQAKYEYRRVPMSDVVRRLVLEALEAREREAEKR